MRDSFSHRICDDLTEVVLNFLPIEDKIKMRSVDRQFRRCLRYVGHKQTVLIVSHQRIMNCRYHRNNYSDLLKHPSYGHEVDVIKLSKVLQIFPNIDEIYFEDNDIINNEDVIKTINKYCSKLKSFSCDSEECSVQTIRQFGQKFGQHIQRIEFNGGEGFILSLIEFPNLKSILNCNLINLFKDQTVLVKNLKKSLIRAVVVRNEKDLFDLFLDSNPNLCYLGLELEGFEKEINHMLKRVVTLKTINKLELRINTKFGRYLTEIDLNVIKKCEQLTHLTLDCNLIADHFFVGFDLFFPNLKYVDIEVRYQMTDRVLQSMSNLKQLESLSLRSSTNCFDQRVSDSGVLSLINGCKRLHRIELNFNSLITDFAVICCRNRNIHLILNEDIISCGLRFGPIIGE